MEVSAQIESIEGRLWSGSRGGGKKANTFHAPLYTYTDRMQNNLEFYIAYKQKYKQKIISHSNEASYI